MSIFITDNIYIYLDHVYIYDIYASVNAKYYL